MPPEVCLLFHAMTDPTTFQTFNTLNSLRMLHQKEPSFFTLKGTVLIPLLFSSRPILVSLSNHTQKWQSASFFYRISSTDHLYPLFTLIPIPYSDGSSLFLIQETNFPHVSSTFRRGHLDPFSTLLREPFSSLFHTPKGPSSCFWTSQGTVLIPRSHSKQTALLFTPLILQRRHPAGYYFYMNRQGDTHLHTPSHTDSQTISWSHIHTDVQT